MMHCRDHYEELGLTPHATLEEIKIAYRRWQKPIQIKL